MIFINIHVGLNVYVSVLTSYIHIFVSTSLHHWTINLQNDVGYEILILSFRRKIVSTHKIAIILSPGRWACSCSSADAVHSVWRDVPSSGKMCCWRAALASGRHGRLETAPWPQCLGPYQKELHIWQLLQVGKWGCLFAGDWKLNQMRGFYFLVKVKLERNLLLHFIFRILNKKWILYYFEFVIKISLNLFIILSLATIPTFISKLKWLLHSFSMFLLSPKAKKISHSVNNN